MLVLNTTSPKVSPAAPKLRPVYTVPSSRASFAGVPDIAPPTERLPERGAYAPAQTGQTPFVIGNQPGTGQVLLTKRPHRLLQQQGRESPGRTRRASGHGFARLRGGRHGRGHRWHGDGHGPHGPLPSAPRRAGGGGPAGGAPDRQQQRRDPLRALLQAR